LRLHLTSAVVLALLAHGAGAQDYPTRSGELGILDVPDAEIAGANRGGLGLELRFDKQPTETGQVGALPAYLVSGVNKGFDLGFSVREGGMPGDPIPSDLLFGFAGKLQLLQSKPGFPGAALSLVLDRVNRAMVSGARLALSMPIQTLRIAAYGGFEVEPKGFQHAGATVGVAMALPFLTRFEIAGEAFTGPRGPDFGGALRWNVSRSTGLSVNVNHLPWDHLTRYSIGLAFSTPRPKVRQDAPEEQTLVAAAAPTEKTPKFLDDRPHFRLRMSPLVPGGDPRSLQYGPWAPIATASPAAAPGPTVARATVPDLDALAEAQLREQEALVDARERRIKSTSDQLDAREKVALAEAKRLEDLEKALGAREKELDAREQRIVVKGLPSQQQRQLESLEAQLAAQERTLAAQERSFAPAIDAANGRERDAAARENGERSEASRLAASVSGASRAQQIELRKQVLAARNRQLASFEAKLVARGERIDSLERQNRAKAERLDAWSRRLDTRAERLELLERRAAEGQPRPATPQKAAEVKPAAKDKAVFVMVVKSPTAIVKERSTGAPSGSPLAAGTAVEKAVAAATVVTFPSPSATLSELDRETIDNIARLAAKESCEVLIWARAKDPSLMAEAQRRAGDIKARVIATGPLPDRQVVTRITTRPGAQGVDVVVSALRETARPAATAATGAAPLEQGESGKRQIREAVLAAQPSIEACVNDLMQTKALPRAEGTLKIAVTEKGLVRSVKSIGTDLAAREFDDCLTRAQGSWVFPSADGDYVVDVPITVVRGGAK
jgi:hypothetical protein